MEAVCPFCSDFKNNKPFLMERKACGYDEGEDWCLNGTYWELHECPKCHKRLKVFRVIEKLWQLTEENTEIYTRRIQKLNKVER